MRITDLLDKQSISLNGVPKDKKEALDQVVDLMAKSGKINDVEAYRQRVYAREEERVQPVSGKVLPFLMVNAMLLQNRDWQLWLSKTVWILIPWMVNRCI